jgi:hypothetical protein
MLQVVYLVFHMFHTFVASVLSGFQVFLQVFQIYVSSVSFSRMLQVLHLDVSKIDRMLHFSHHNLLPRLNVSPPPPGAGWASTVLSRSSRCW